MRRELFYLLSAKTFSDFGYAFDFICFGTFIWLQTHSPFATACLSATLYGGRFLGAKIVHQYGDMWNRRCAMLFSDLLRMAMLLLLFSLPFNQKLTWIYPTVFIIGIGRTVFESTLTASLPVISGNRLQLINSLSVGLRGAALILGMLFASVATKQLGFNTLFFLDALTYAISAAVLWRTTLHFRDENVSEKTEGAPSRVRLRLLHHFGFLLWAVVIVRGIDAFGSGTHHVGLPMLGAQFNESDPASAFGKIWAMWGVGMMIGSFFFRPLIAKAVERIPQKVFFCATALMSLGFIIIFWSKTWPMIFAGALCAGCGDGMGEIAFRQTLQREKDLIRGSLFGLSEMVMNTGFIVGMLFTGWVAIPTTIAHWVLALHGLPIVASVLILSLFSTKRSILKPECME
ncbi:MAG: hypothetical protein CO021_01560 [Deltaproteobacteria bacterium CG_4_9_14_0_2_um_filter_42_21]|nr:MAG: hypothetical protein CO021_01560 [Deltaproteobacteria bacterium CG_4_9_14_0_2_um_filter_42_21]